MISWFSSRNKPTALSPYGPHNPSLAAGVPRGRVAMGEGSLPAVSPGSGTLIVPSVTYQAGRRYRITLSIENISGGSGGATAIYQLTGLPSGSTFEDGGGVRGVSVDPAAQSSLTYCTEFLCAATAASIIDVVASRVGGSGSIAGTHALLTVDDIGV